MFNFRKILCVMMICSLFFLSDPVYKVDAQELSEYEKQQMLEQISALIKILTQLQLQLQLKNMENNDIDKIENVSIEPEEYIKKGDKVLFNNDHVLGYVNGKVTILAYVDYQSPAVKELNRVLEKIRINSGYEVGKVSVVYRHYPLESTYKGSTLIAEASECLSKHVNNDAYWGFTQSVIKEGLTTPVEKTNVISRARLMSGFPSSEVESCIWTRGAKDEVEKDINRAKKEGVTKVPYVIVYLDGYEVDRVEGNISYDEMLRKIDNILGVKRSVNKYAKNGCKEHCLPSFAPEYKPKVVPVGNGKAELIDGNTMGLFTLKFTVEAPSISPVYIPYNYILGKGGISVGGKRVEGTTVHNTRTQEIVSVLSMENAELDGNSYGSFIKVEAGEKATITMQLKFRPAYGGEYYANIWNLTYFIEEHNIFYDIDFNVEQEGLVKTLPIYIEGPEYVTSGKG